MSVGRSRVSATVDEELLANARRALPGLPDSAVLDRALATLLHEHRAAEFDAAYAVYEEHPLGEPDAWGDLASFREAAVRRPSITASARMPDDDVA